MKYAALSVLIAWSLTTSAVGQEAPGQRRKKPKPPATEMVEDRGIAEYVGQVQAAETVQQLAPFAGRAIRQLVPPGSAVKKGQAILVLSQKALGESYANYTAKANLDGILNEYHVTQGNEFGSGAPIFTILDTRKHRIKIVVSNKDHAQINIGDAVILTPEGKRETADGSVYRKSLVPIAGSGLFEIEIDVPRAIPIGTFCRIKFQSPQTVTAGEKSEKKETDQSAKDAP